MFAHSSKNSWSSGVAATTAPPITSLWPFRYFVVEWITTSAPHSMGRWSAGDMKVLSATTSAPASLACLTGGFQVGDPEQRVAGRLDQDQLRPGGESRRHGVPVRQIDELDFEKAALLAAVQEPERAAVAVVGRDDPVPRVQQLAYQGHGRHAGGGDDRAVTALGLGERIGEGRTRRVAGARVVVGALAVQAGEGEVGREVQRRNDRSVVRRRWRAPRGRHGLPGRGSRSCESPVEKGVVWSRLRGTGSTLSREDFYGE